MQCNIRKLEGNLISVIKNLYGTFFLQLDTGMALKQIETILSNPLILGGEQISVSVSILANIADNRTAIASPEVSYIKCFGNHY